MAKHWLGKANNSMSADGQLVKVGGVLTVMVPVALIDPHPPVSGME